NLPGFVVIVYEKTSYEMRLWIAVALVLALISILYLIFSLVRAVLSGALRVKGWHGGRHWRRSRRKTIQGMLAFTEGRWKASEDAMVGAAKTSDTKLINYLIAAQAAQHQNAEVRRDAYLRLAHQAEPEAKVAIGLTQAQLQIQQGQNEQALASLNELKTKNPNHPYVLKLLCRLFEKLQDWDQLMQILPALKKQQVFAKQELQAVELSCVEGILGEQAKRGNIEELNNQWQALPSAMRKVKTHLICYAQHLIQFGQMDQAEAILKPLIKKSVDEQVLSLYGMAETTNPAKHLAFLESWLNSNPDAPKVVYLTLGKLAFQSELWGKARHFLEQSLMTAASPESYLLMAKTLEKLDEHGRAAACYQQGLEFITKPKQKSPLTSLPAGSDDLINAELLPRFQKAQD
ncbi:MAG: hypothetical protein OQK04_01840, partial [Kangiellaceae bacterium]|nr:hypothetical protein [Kangiellaceae bacterium]